MLRLILQGENLEPDLWWLDPVTAMLEHRSLHEGVAIEEPRCPYGVMRCWCGYGHCCSLSIADLFALGFSLA